MEEFNLLFRYIDCYLAKNYRNGVTLSGLFLESRADGPAWSGVVLAVCVLGEDGVCGGGSWLPPLPSSSLRCCHHESQAGLFIHSFP